jgi:iturin family lipopeptide synthetase A
MPEFTEDQPTGLEIAIIGMAGRFPGAKNIEMFWDNLEKGKESLQFFTEDELRDMGVLDERLKDPNFVKAKGGVLEDKEYFDAGFFGYTPKEAEAMSPQMRIFHESAWEALENAGYTPEKYRGSIGIYAGASTSFFWEVCSILSGKHQDLGTLDARQLANRDFMSTRISYKLGLKGPSFTLQTACSTSLVALDLACRGLLTGQCSMALAGGVTAFCFYDPGYLYQEGIISSPDGHCRAFDAESRGTIQGEGVGVLVLKLLEEALTDRDYIHAVIKGTSTNNDGNRKIGYTAPSVQGQMEVIKAAMSMAEVEPETITYVEAHGTGTTLGDPVEIEALTQAFETSKKHFCGIGSVKTNVGHLDAAAGVTSIIKTVMALKHRLLPPSLHYQTPNPKIDFENSPFYVVSELTPWESNGTPLRAGVSSFGIGGTNAHVILEEAPTPPPALNQGGHDSDAPPDISEGTGRGEPLCSPINDVASTPAGSPAISEIAVRGESCIRPNNSCLPQMILLSARTQTALDKIMDNQASYLEKNPVLRIQDVAYTLNTGRKLLPFRKMLVCKNTREAIELLTDKKARKSNTFVSFSEKTSVVFMFPGLGGHYVNMGRELYETEPVFQQEMDRCFEILEKLEILDENIKEILYPHPPALKGCGAAAPTTVGSPALSEIAVREEHWTPTQTQVILFIFEYALAKMLMHWGITPYAMIGYSFGEYTAACISGVFPIEDGLKMIVSRGKLIQTLTPGRMLSVPLPKQEVESLLKGELFIAIDNGESCVLSGPVEKMVAFENQMKEKKILCMAIPATHALHSPMMEPILEEYQKIVQGITLDKPEIPYISNVTGKWMTVEEAMDPMYWALHLAKTVQFSQGIEELVKEENSVFIEIGPGHDLSALMSRRMNQESNQQVVSLVRPEQRKQSDLHFLLNKIGQLCLFGNEIDWESFYENEERYRLPLPTYPFERQKYWFRGLKTSPLHWAAGLQKDKKELKKNKNISQWFYVPQWRRSLLKTHNLEQDANDYTWILIGGHPIWTSHLEEQLKSKGINAIVVQQSTEFRKISSKEYHLDPCNQEDFLQLFQDILRGNKTKPLKILHLLHLKEESNVNGESLKIEEMTPDHSGFLSLINLVKALAAQKTGNRVHLEVITQNLREVTGQEMLDPRSATLLGPLNVIPQEYPNIQCRHMDIESPCTEAGKKELLDQVIKEMMSRSTDTEVAFRNHHRWVLEYETHSMPGDFERIPKIKQNGVYLITGGLGRVGLSLADYLVTHFQAKLVLTGRSRIPQKEEWGKWLEEHDDTDPVSQKIIRINELENKGGQILAFALDAGNKKEVREKIEEAEHIMGSINGVVHAAGMTGKGIVTPIQYVREEESEKQFLPKVKGLMVLAELFQDRELDFCILISSLSPVLGGLGFATYSAANIYMDTFVHYYNKQYQKKWISVNWGDWDFRKNRKKGAVGGALAELMMSPDQGVETFKRILFYYPAHQVVISAGDLQIRIEQWVKLESLRKEEETGEEKTAGFTRPVLSTAYVEPKNQVEKDIAGIWKKMFGFEDIGIQDDFFELGGDSLKAITVISRIHKQLDVLLSLAEFFRNPVIEELAQYISSAGKQEHQSIPVAEKKEYYSLSSAQKRLFILQGMDKRSVAYNEFQVLRVGGDVDKDKYQETFRKLIHLHESLRTSFKMVGAEPGQFIHPDVDFSLEGFDLTQVEDSLEREAEQKKIIRGFLRPFSLGTPPLFRAGLISLGKNNHILMIDLHHIITDGISNQVLVREFLRIYQGQEPPLFRIQYKDYAEWKNSKKEKENIEKQEQFWLKQMQGELPVLDLLTDYPRPRVQDFSGDLYSFELNSNETRGLKELASQEESTLYMILLAIFNVLLMKISGQEDIVVGSLTAGRNHSDIQQIIGMFVNTLAIRNYPQGHKSFRQFSKEVRNNTLEIFENQDYPFEDLVDKVGINRDMSRNPLFDVLFMLQNLENTEVSRIDREQQGIKRATYEFIEKMAKFDMNLVGVERQGKILFSFEYGTRLFSKKTMELLVNYLKGIVNSVVQEPDQQISEIEIMNPKQKNQLLHNFNQTQKDYPTDITIPELFEKQVEKYKHSISLNINEYAVTYESLNSRTNQLARDLRTRNIGPKTLVGVKMGRSLDMITGIMGILKAGGAYLPIEPDYPEERVTYMLRDSGTQWVLVDHSEGTNTKTFEENLFLEVNTVTETNSGNLTPLHQPQDISYVIYTSGSTGKPKGVVIQHASVVNIIFALFDNYPLKEQDSYLLKTSFIFDVSVSEIFGWFLGGGKLIILEKESHKDPHRIMEVIEKSKVTHINFVPSLFNVFVDMLDHQNIKTICSLKYMFFAGEALLPQPIKKLQQLNKKIQLENLYGPTEGTIYASKFSLSQWGGSGDISIGNPVQNVFLYVCDPAGNLQVIGAVGELCIAGAGLFRGYLNNPDLTHEKAEINPFEPGTKLYRTGDLVKWMPDGNIKFLGRRDHQIKIRGFRVEMGEIENKLMGVQNVKEALVVLTGTESTEDKSLCAYVVTDEEILSSHLQAYLLKELPEYMVPTYFVRLKQMPLTPGGKVDRSQLPAPQELQAKAGYVGPRDWREEKIQEIWSQVLKIEKEKIGIDSSFFELGGHSLNAITMISRIHKILNVRVPMVEFFKFSRIRGLSEYIRNQDEERYEIISSSEKRDYYPVSSAQRRIFILQQLDKQNTSYNMPEVVILQGAVARDNLDKACLRMIKRHDIFRTSFGMIEGEPSQIIHSDTSFELLYFEMCNPESEVMTPEQREKRILEDLLKPFDLSKAPMMRVGLIQREKESILVANLHHIISDGVSTGIFVKEMMHSYWNQELPALPLQYKDYSQWQNNRLKRRIKEIQEQEQFWCKKFEGEVPVLNLPTDFPRPSVQDFSGNHLDFEIGKNETEEIFNLANTEEATLYMVLISVFHVLLWKISGQEDIVLGTPTAGRNQPELHPLIGMFVNTLVLRNNLSSTLSFSDFLKEVKQKTLLAFENQEYQFEDLVEKVVTRRDLSRSPLFDVMFVMQNLDFQSPEVSEIEVPQLKIKPYGYRSRTSKFDITLMCREKNRKLLFTLEYCAALFSKDTIHRFIDYFKRIVTFIINESQQTLGNVEIISPQEKQQVLYDFNQNDFDYKDTRTVIQLFEDITQKYPDRSSLSFQEHTLTFDQFNQKANQLCGKLKSEGVEENHVVGLLMERSLEMMQGIFGILKASAGYLPLDPGYPGERISFMLKDSQSSILLTGKPHLTKVIEEGMSSTALKVFDLREDSQQTKSGSDMDVSPSFPDSQPSNQSSAEKIFYVIYTSGSTGKPKGSMIKESSFLNTLHWYIGEFVMVTRDRVLLIAPIGFDLSQKNLFCTFITGGQLCVYLPQLQDYLHLSDYIQKEKITIINCAPSVFYPLIEFNQENELKKLESLREIFLGGEPINIEKVLPLKEIYQDKVEIVNTYGPTECTDISTFYRIKQEDYQEKKVIPIGQAILNIKLYILDEKQQVLPIGLAGELCIGGISLSRGYSNNPGLTQERFMSTPHLPEQKVYRTGDLCRWLADGNIDILGRIDFQVKIRGTRIELGEIENQLLDYQDIKEAIVTARQDKNHNNYLCACVVSLKKIEIPVLKDYLSQKLPDYMVPSFIIQLEEIPLTPSGKKDRNALPKPEEIDQALEIDFINPDTEEEKRIAGFWKEVLGVERVGLDNNFFDLGGHSLDIIRVNTKLKEAFDVELPVVMMFRYPTVRALAQFIKNDHNKDEFHEQQQEVLSSVGKGRDKLKERIRKRRGNKSD